MMNKTNSTTLIEDVTSNMDDVYVFCADIGSIGKNFGWYARNLSINYETQGKDINELLDEIILQIKNNKKVAIGFECPLYIPIPKESSGLLKQRIADRGKPWSASAGATVLAAGIAEVSWLLRGIREKFKNENIEVFLDWLDFVKSNTGIFFWEAFVSGKDKEIDICLDGKECDVHIKDAMIAVKKFFDNISSIEQEVEGDVISLIGAAMLKVGLVSDISYLSKSCIVV